MKCIQLICAQSIVTDKTTNQVSILNIFETLQSSTFPVLIQNIALYIAFLREDNDPVTVNPTLEVTINDNILHNLPLQITFIEPDLRNNTTINMQGFVISQPGVVHFRIKENNIELKSFEAKIIQT